MNGDKYYYYYRYRNDGRRGNAGALAALRSRIANLL